MEVEGVALDLIALAYDAALAPEKWRALMERLVRAMGARSAGLREADCDAGDVRLFETVGYDPAFVAAYRQHFVRIDNLNSAYLNTPVHTVLTSDEVMPWARQCKTEFGSDYVIAQKIRHMMGTILARDGNYHLLLGVQRELGQPAFDADERRLLGLVAPHIARAAHIHRQMADVTAQKHWAFSALDRLRVGVILLDERGRPLFANREAERLAATRGGFAAGREGLALPSSAGTLRLRRLIADAATLATGRGAIGGGCLRTAGNGGTAMQFQVIPLPQGLSERPIEQSLPGGCVAVFVSACGGPRLSPERIAALHGLTPAEARVAALLAKGMSPEEAAESLSVSIHTVRAQIKSVFSKTGVTRQPELVALLLADMLTDPADGQSEDSASQ